MQKNKAAMMRRLRRERKEQGLVELRAWLTPDHKSVIDRQIKCLEVSEKKSPLAGLSSGADQAAVIEQAKKLGII